MNEQSAKTLSPEAETLRRIDRHSIYEIMSYTELEDIDLTKAND